MGNNNLDLIRLAAAFQVMLDHAIEHTRAPVPATLRDAIDLVPGVPIFFAISGYLIYQSYAKIGDRLQFYKNRALRLYPGLVFCFVSSVALLFAVGYLNSFPPDFVSWSIAQLTFVQFYNPQFMRGFGVGVLNGSLWTISVELQFYLLTPVLYHIARGRDSRFIALIAVFVLFNLLHIYTENDTPARKLYAVTFFPWFYMFIVGAYLAERPDIISFFRDRAPLFAATYLVAAYLCSGFMAFGNRISPPFFAILVAAVFALAFYENETADKLLHKNDISYGIYIFHMPVINTLLYLGMASVHLSVALTILFAAVSWFLIERPALRLKRLTLRAV